MLTGGRVVLAGGRVVLAGGRVVLAEGRVVLTKGLLALTKGLLVIVLKGDTMELLITGSIGFVVGARTGTVVTVEFNIELVVELIPYETLETTDGSMG